MVVRNIAIQNVNHWELSREFFIYVTSSPTSLNNFQIPVSFHSKETHLCRNCLCFCIVFLIFSLPNSSLYMYKDIIVRWSRDEFWMKNGTLSFSMMFLKKFFHLSLFHSLQMFYSRLSLENWKCQWCVL